MLASLIIAQAFAAGRKYILPNGAVVFGEDKARALLAEMQEEEAPVNRIGSIPAKKRTKKVPKVKRISEARLRQALDEAEDRARRRDDDDLISIILAME